MKYLLSAARKTGNIEAEPVHKSYLAWLVLALFFFTRLGVALQFQSVASVAPTLAQDFKVEFAALGTLIGLYMLPGVALSIPGGVLMQRYGSRELAVAGLLLMSGGAALMAMSPSVMILFAGRIASGGGAVLLGLALPRMLGEWFAGSSLVTAMSILISSWPFGIAIGLVSIGPISDHAGWRIAVLTTLVLPVASFFIFAFFLRSRPHDGGTFTRYAKIRLNKAEWLAACLSGAAYGLFNVAYVAIVSFGSDVLVSGGYSSSDANFIVSIVGWTLVVTLPIGGFITEKSERPVTCIVTALVLMMLASVAFTYLVWPVVFLLIVALSSGFLGGTIVALPVQALRVQSRSLGLGIFYTWYFGLMAVLPGVIGYSRDIGQIVTAPILVAGILALLAACIMLVFGFVQSRSVRV